MRPQLSIAIILINYKSEERTIKCIKEELMQCTLPHRIVVVNNGATAASNKQMADELGGVIVYDIEAPIDTMSPQVFVVNNVENSGFARGNNLGVDFITTHFDVEYLLFSNNDIVLRSERAIESLTEKLATLPDVGVIGPKVIGLDGNCQSPNNYVPFWSEMVFNYWKRFLPFLKTTDVFNQNLASEGYYYRVMGSFFMTIANDYILCGKMDENTFLYGEEVILAERMISIKKRFYYYPNIEIIHEHGVTINKNSGSKVVQDAAFNSLAYYYKTYKDVSSFSIVIAWISNRIYRTLQNFYRRK